MGVTGDRNKCSFWGESLIGVSSRKKGGRNKKPHVHNSEVGVLKMGEITRLCAAGNVPEERKKTGEAGEIEESIVESNP